MRHEKALRAIAGTMAILWAALAIASFFRHRDPRDSAVSVILFRLAFYSLLSFTFIRRTFGAKMHDDGWLAVGALTAVSAWDAHDGMGIWGVAVFASLAILSFVAHALQKRHSEPAHRSSRD